MASLLKPFGIVWRYCSQHYTLVTDCYPRVLTTHFYRMSPTFCGKTPHTLLVAHLLESIPPSAKLKPTIVDENNFYWYIFLRFFTIFNVSIEIYNGHQVLIFINISLKLSELNVIYIV